MNDPIIAKVIFQMFILLLTAKVLGNLFSKIGYPSVIGEFLAGVVWGPSLMKWLFPNTYNFIFPEELGTVDDSVLGIMTILGLLTLLTISGTEINKFPKKMHKMITMHTLLTIVSSFFSGFILLLCVPKILKEDNINSFDLGFFLSICLMMSALPIISRILNDWGIGSSIKGQFLLLSTVTIDLVGWLFLSVGIIFITSHSKQSSLIFLTEKVIVVLLGIIALLFVGRIFLRFLERKKINYLFWPTLLGFCVYTHYILGINIYIGALLFGLAISTIPTSKEKLTKGLDGFSVEVFIPLFFASIGHHGNILIFKDFDIVIFCILLLLSGFIVKLVPTLILRFFNFSWREIWLISFCLNARGGMEIIIASVGISFGVFNTEMYTVLITVAILTAISCPWFMNKYMKNIQQLSYKKYPIN